MSGYRTLMREDKSGLEALVTDRRWYAIYRRVKHMHTSAADDDERLFPGSMHEITKTAGLRNAYKIPNMAQLVRGASVYTGSVLHQCATKPTLFRQSATSANQTPPWGLVWACYDGNEVTVQRYLQRNSVDLNYQVPQCCAHFHYLPHTSMHMIALRCSKLTTSCAACKSLLLASQHSQLTRVYVHACDAVSAIE
jgi:hypothetical protein